MILKAEKNKKILPFTDEHVYIFGRKVNISPSGGEINFSNVKLPVHPLMTEIYMCGGKSQFPLEGMEGKSQPSDSFASGCVHRALN